MQGTNPAAQRASQRVRSADGTAITVECSGSGPALVVVDPALAYSGFDNVRGLAALLGGEFAVWRYDRRGRGASGDTPPFAVAREVEDVEAVIEASGGSAFVYGFSSGGLLALHAAAAGVAIDKLALFEPPVRAKGEPPDTTFANEIAELVAAGARGTAVDYFLTSIGVPGEVIAEMAPVRPALEAVAHTLVYDCEISNATTLELLESVRTPTLVLDSGGSSDYLTGGTTAIADALPKGTRRSLPGEWHGVADEDLAPVLAAFFQDGRREEP
jgi:pimeloyl-ACP methyl ester carboxylesterase